MVEARDMYGIKTYFKTNGPRKQWMDAGEWLWLLHDEGILKNMKMMKKKLLTYQINDTIRL